MELTPIRNEADYQAALNKLETVFNTKKGTPEGDHLEILSILIDTYENEHFPIGLPDPVEDIKFRLEQMGMKHISAEVLK